MRESGDNNGVKSQLMEWKQGGQVHAYLWSKAKVRHSAREGMSRQSGKS